MTLSIQKYSEANAIKRPVWHEPRIQASPESRVLHDLFLDRSIDRLAFHSGVKERLVFVTVVESSENDYISVPAKHVMQMQMKVGNISRGKPVPYQFPFEE